MQGIYRGQRIRTEYGIPLDAKVILSVGEVNTNKNHKVGIEALAKLDDKNTYYVICGRGPLMKNHKELAQSLGVNDRVIFTGYRTDVADFYKMADVFFFPSFREGLPVALMEAMASGLPCVGSDIRGVRDLIDSRGGYICLQKDFVAYTGALNMLFDNRDLKEKLGKYNQEKIKNYSIEIVKEKIYELYKCQKTN